MAFENIIYCELQKIKILPFFRSYRKLCKLRHLVVHVGGHFNIQTLVADLERSRSATKV